MSNRNEEFSVTKVYKLEMYVYVCMYVRSDFTEVPFLTFRN